MTFFFQVYCLLARDCQIGRFAKHSRNIIAIAENQTHKINFSHERLNILCSGNAA
jgi:hypothetical protein